ncbi:hypothetical protein GDO81_020730 [Engystomops pustulosus]|uniref:Uncharacterized protein n=1 Tax=Engystomops pustulosus TaxID=76066 RepID=A0AAV6YU35_ENGPU|nr:hypothetical protein GDO81_020730 [Engystomops pustulosus]
MTPPIPGFVNHTLYRSTLPDRVGRHYRAVAGHMALSPFWFRISHLYLKASHIHIALLLLLNNHLPALLTILQLAMLWPLCSEPEQLPVCPYLLTHLYLWLEFASTLKAVAFPLRAYQHTCTTSHNY